MRKKTSQNETLEKLFAAGTLEQQLLWVLLQHQQVDLDQLKQQQLQLW